MLRNTVYLEESKLLGMSADTLEVALTVECFDPDFAGEWLEEYDSLSPKTMCSPQSPHEASPSNDAPRALMGSETAQVSPTAEATTTDSGMNTSVDQSGSMPDGDGAQGRMRRIVESAG